MSVQCSKFALKNDSYAMSCFDFRIQHSLTWTDQKLCYQAMEELLKLSEFSWTSCINRLTGFTALHIALSCANLTQVAKIPNLRASINVGTPRDSVYPNGFVEGETPLFQLLDRKNAPFGKLIFVPPLLKEMNIRVKVAVDCFGANVNIANMNGVDTPLSATVRQYISDMNMNIDISNFMVMRRREWNDVMITLIRRGAVAPNNTDKKISEIIDTARKEIAESDAALKAQVVTATTLISSLAKIVVEYAQDGLPDDDIMAQEVHRMMFFGK